MTAKPQQMSGQPDTSDDLIAELAKLMATNAKPEPTPATAAKLAVTPAPIPIRIPGSDLPPRVPGGDLHPVAATRPFAEQRPAETRPAAPVVRIPGMDLPPPGVAASTAGPPAPVAQPFEPRVVAAEHATPATPIHIVPAPPPAPASLDPIAAIIAAELDSPAAAPTAGAADAAASQRFPAAPSPPRFSAPPRPASAQVSSAPRPMPLSLASQGRAAPATPINLKQINAPRAIPVESDTFGVPPVLGFGGKPSARGSVDSDPMDEIESLIGEAVRVEMDRPAPVVTPVGGLAPRRTQPIEPKSEATAPRSADEAILAAAAATGADLDVIDSPEVGRRERPAKVVVPAGERRSGSMRQYIGMAVAGTLLLAAGFGLYWVIGMGRGDGTVPVLTADASPVKVAPDPTANTASIAEPRSPVLDELDGVADTSGETLVSTDQSADTDVAAVSEDEILESGLANRKVRTVTVRPDGTIVSGEDAVAGSEALPVGRPNVPDVPSDAAAATDVLASAAEGLTATDPIAAAIANPDGTPATIDLALADPATTQPVNLDPSIPIPMPPMLNRPTEPMVADAAPLSAVNATSDDPLPGLATTTGGQPVDLLAPIEVPPVTQAAEAPPPTSTPGNPAPAYVQLSAQRDEATALADARRFTQRFSGVIGETPLEVHIVDLGAKGTWYRVLLPASSSSAANTACANIKNAGGDCLIR